MRNAALVLLAAVAVLSGCKHGPTPREEQASDIHHDLGIQAQLAANRQEAYAEFEKALAR